MRAIVAATVLWLPVAGLAQRGQFSPDEMRQWLSYIASDELQGREVFTEGFGLAGAYIADHLKAWRIEPAGDAGTYFQTVSVLGMRSRSNSSVTVTRGDESRTFKDGEGVTFPRNQGGRQTISAPLEFVGYGLDYAPLNHDDYAGRDMKGKIALFIGRGIRGMTATHNRLINGRARNAVELEHAAAAIGPVVPNPGRGRRDGAPGDADDGRGGVPAPAPPAAAANPSQRVDFQTTRDLNLPIAPQITATDEFFTFIFLGSGYSYDDLKAAAAKQEPLPEIALRNVTITITVDAEYERVQTRLTRNVVGLVRGTDARLRDTYVALGAHYDHIGYQQFAPTGTGNNLIAACAGQTRPVPRSDDIVNNGADDDGSGTVSLMAIGKAFAASRPKRSVLLVWHSGEEAGLYGSRYMADHPVLPLDRMLAMLNMDMMGRNRCDRPDEANKVYLVGSERISTELHNINEDANASLRRPLTLDYEYNDVSDLESVYTRSDHYSYAAKGVPIIFFTTGLHRDYHFRTDEVGRIEFAKMARIAELVYTTATRVANLDHAPARDFAGPRMGQGRTGGIR
jgi:hypothetical protein